jgi:hypothetical protein
MCHRKANRGQIAVHASIPAAADNLETLATDKEWVGGALYRRFRSFVICTGVPPVSKARTFEIGRHV